MTKGPVETDELRLRVVDALPEDVGQQLVRVPSEIMSRIGVPTHGIVELTGRKTTVARVAPLPTREIEPQLIARLESICRQNAGVAIGERVQVRKSQVRPARTLVLSPSGGTRSTFTPEEGSSLAKALADRAVVAGDSLVVNWPGALPSYFEVHSSAPQGSVLITIATRIAFAEGEENRAAVHRTAYEDIGGLDEEVRRIREMVELPIRFPQVFEQLGVEAPRGVLLHGPPGTGKTLIARAVANETSATFIHINGPEVVNKLYGESEARLREIFDMAQREAPAIIFIDEIDAIAPKRTEVFGDVEKRIVAQLLALMDGLSSRGEVVVIAATNVPHMIDPALRRPGRFDRELSINPPDRDGRERILHIHTRSMKLDPAVNIEHLADVTHGFVGADLAVLCKEAGMLAIRRVLEGPDLPPESLDPEQTSRLCVTASDFEEAFREVEPTAVRELFADKPTATWNEVGGLNEVKERLARLLSLSLELPATMRSGRRYLPRGILLTGPSGSGKTLAANALAGSSGVHFISVEPATMASRWRGEGERGIRQTFRRAKQIAPCIIFLDEIDTLAPRRAAEAIRETDSMVSQLCVELDHLMETAGVIVIAATSRPEAVDPSLMRPGRFDLIVDLPMPDASVRHAILMIHTRDLSLALDVDLMQLAKSTEGMSGADLAALCRNALLNALQRHSGPRAEFTACEQVVLTAVDFEDALGSAKSALDRPTASQAGHTDRREPAGPHPTSPKEAQ